jgi:hypothetical protein
MRNGQTMNIVVFVGVAVVMVMVAMGTYNLQWWLERSDYLRHFED